MTERDPVVAEELERLVPVTTSLPDWENVLERKARALRRRPLVLALAAALVVLAVAAAVTAAVGGFAPWLTGLPGRPADHATQAGFTAANGRSWAAFPAEVKLRELIRTIVGGREFTLYGFRSGNSVCLRLDSDYVRGFPGEECAAASTLTHISSPILIVDRGSVLTDSHHWPRAQVAFGIVADGISQVTVHATDGDHPATVGGNAFLWIEPDPISGNRVISVTASSGGRSFTIEPTSLRTGFTIAPAKRATGPAKVQATIRKPRIRWFARHEQRGKSPAQAKLTADQRMSLDGGFRLFKPDPLSDVVVGVSEGCITIVQRGAAIGCGPRFFRGPVDAMMSVQGGQVMTVAGVAADGVKRIEIYLANGERQTAALRDNVFLAVVPLAPPLRIVGFNQANEVVATNTSDFLMQAAPRAAITGIRPIRKIVGPAGAVATVAVGPIVRPSRRSHATYGVRCWRISFTGARNRSACAAAPGYTGPRLWIDFVQPSGNDLFVVGEVREPVIRVQLHFADGGTVTTRPVAGLFIAAIPRRYLRHDLQRAYAVGYDRQGDHVQRGGFFFRTR